MVEKKGAYIENPIPCLVCAENTYHKVEARSQIKEIPLLGNTQKEDYYSMDTSEKILEYEVLTNKTITIQQFAQIIVCKDCKNVSLRIIEIEKEDEKILKERLLPPRKDLFIQKKYENEITGETWILYKESIITYNHSLNFSCGAALRTLLESFCKERGHKNTVFKRCLSEFCRKNVREESSLSNDEVKKLEIASGLSKQLKELKKEIKSIRPNLDINILDEVLDWGNENIHDSKFPTQDELKNVIEMIDYIFDILIFEQKRVTKFNNNSEDFKNRRSSTR